MTRRSLHRTLAATMTVLRACEDPRDDAPVGSSTGGMSGEGAGSETSAETRATAGADVTAEEALVSLADNVFAPTHAAFSEAADALSAAATHVASVADGGDTAAAREALEAAYTDTARALQHVDLLQLGPAVGSAGVVVTGVLSGVFSFLFGPRTIELQLWGVNALGFAVRVVSGNLRHSHVRWSFGPRLEMWLVSPAQHQLRHGSAAADCASNLGTWLAVWDRVAGSHRLARDQEPHFGLLLEACNHRADSVLSALLDPMLACGTRMLSWPRTSATVVLLLVAATFTQDFG